VSLPRRGLLLAVAGAGALAVPAAASAHAYLVRTVPAQNQLLKHAPARVALTFDEAVEPRFATISVTDAKGTELTSAAVTRSPSNPDTLLVPVKARLQQGWYLVYWRAISVDGHPVQGYYTFGIGPAPGAPPQFHAPNDTASATTPDVVAMRWLAFLSVMGAIGLFALRIGVARPLERRLEGVSLRPVSTAFAAAAALALVAVPAYLDVATAIDAQKPVVDVPALVPLFRVTAFGRAWLDLELCFALFCVAAAVALRLDRPDRERRSLAELFATAGAALAAAAVLLVPGLAGHAAQTAPRSVSLLLDWVHLAAGSIWVGGLTGLIVLAASLPAGLRVSGLALTVPRFSNVAFVSVLLLLASGIGATVVHMPLLAALWQTSYGVTVLVKAGLLAAALAFAAVNLLRAKPRLARAAEQIELGEPAARLLRRAIGGEAVLVAAAVLAAAVLSSLAPPPAALAAESSKLATVGPGRVSTVVRTDGYALQVLVSPNKVGVTDLFGLRVTKGGKPVRGAEVRLSFGMLAMDMGTLVYGLQETAPGLYTRRAPALVMAGRWSLSFAVTPRGGAPFSALVIDRTTG
jgi:copper transport protein